MKILFTAFKGIHNPSFQLVERLGANSVLLTNSFQGLEKDVVSLDGDYSAVLMFGVNKTLVDKVRIETCAQCNGETVYTDFDVLSLETRLRNGNISYTVSDKPARYLCNAAYYHMLRKNLNTVFIHIPSAKGMGVDTMNRLVMIVEQIQQDSQLR